jgi:NADPH:quinone reductase-like Zn-dependent oxidoreductase
MTEMMKAVCIHRYGASSELVYQDLPRPLPGEGELLIRVHAAGVNPVDCKTRSGSALANAYGDRFPLVLGWDVAGVVEAVGQGVTGFVEGDAVYGMVHFPQPGGAYAEYVTAPAEQLAHKPDSVDFLEAAALPLVSLTAWQAIFEAGELAAGQTVLIHGAAGGVGHVAVQQARWRGARIVGTARSRDEEFLQGLGLDVLVDYRTARFEEIIGDVDVVLDTFGGEIQERSWGVLKPGGILVTLRTTPDLEEKAAAHGHRGRGLRAKHVLVRPQPEHWASINDLVASGQLRPVVAAVYPLHEVAAAHDRLERGPTRGKIVLRVTSPAN